jgi:hypothetical protein
MMLEPPKMLLLTLLMDKVSGAYFISSMPICYLFDVLQLIPHDGGGEKGGQGSTRHELVAKMPISLSTAARIAVDVSHCPDLSFFCSNTLYAIYTIRLQHSGRSSDESSYRWTELETLRHKL